MDSDIPGPETLPRTCGLPLVGRSRFQNWLFHFRQGHIPLHYSAIKEAVREELRTVRNNSTSRTAFVYPSASRTTTGSSPHVPHLPIRTHDMEYHPEQGSTTPTSS